MTNVCGMVDTRPDVPETTNGMPRLAIRGLQSAQAGPLSLDLAAGECVAIVGASGAGKSVFLRLIADLDAGSGEVLLDGVRRETWPASRWRSMVVYQAAEPGWWEATVAAHFLPAELELVRAMLSPLLLEPGLLDTALAGLSTGERQRFALIRSLVCAPKVLLLDEPAAALDKAATLAMESLLHQQLAGSMAMIIVTHSEEQAMRMGNRTMRMTKGQLEPL